ncbi:MAG: conserved repeat domain [Ramlibacter sp.]|nr:conserved repeat domain [Ramlibacter sp.]
MNKQFIFATLLALAAATSPALAQTGAGDIEFRNVAEQEVDVKAADGKVEKKRVAVAKAIPGAEIIYTSTFRNVGKRPAANIQVVNPVPANTVLVGGSAFGENTEITYSADGAKTWATADKVKVKGADGKERPAGISELTHVRWVYRGELAPGKQAAVGFRVVVN